MAGLSVASQFTIERKTSSLVPPTRKTCGRRSYAFRRIDEELKTHSPAMNSI